MTMFGKVFEAAEKYGKMRVTCSDGTKFVGELFALSEAADSEGESLGYDVATFKVETPESGYVDLREEQILSIENL